MLRIFFSLIFLIAASSSYGEVNREKPTLHFAGLFLLSQSDLQSNSIKKEFKYLSAIYDEEYYKEISEKIRASIIENKDLPFQIKDDFGRISNNDSLAVGLVFSKENFIFLPSSGSRDEVLLDGLVVLNLIIFDFKKNVLLDFTPFPIAFAEKFDNRSQAEAWIKEKMLKKNLLLNDEKFYKPLVKKIKGLNLEKRLNRFQVRDVKLENSVKSLLEKDQVNLELHQTFVAQQLEAALSNYLPITLIPHGSRRGSIDDASIGLLSVFNDRDNFQLKLPSPDYYIDVTVRDLKLIRNPSEGEYRRVADILSYGVFNTIELKESKTEEVKFSSKFFKKDSVLIRKDLDLESIENSQIKWGYYNVNQFKLFLSFAEQIKEKNLAKLKTITNNETIVNEMAIIERLINK
jgi:hypothetical protein